MAGQRPALRGDIIAKDAPVSVMKQTYKLAAYEIITIATTWDTRTEVHLLKDGSGYCSVSRRTQRGRWVELKLIKWDREEAPSGHVPAA